MEQASKIDTPSPLTRRDVESLTEVLGAVGEQTDEPMKRLLAHDAAQRLTIERLERELAESERKLREVCMAHGPALIEIHDLKQTIERLERERDAALEGRNGAIEAKWKAQDQLAAMTTERNEALALTHKLQNQLTAASIRWSKEDELLKQLATAQARVRELELDVAHRDRTIQEHIAKQGELQATLAAVQQYHEPPHPQKGE